MHFAAILLSALALRQVQGAPTPAEIEVTVRIEDPTVPHHIDKYPSFYLAVGSDAVPNLIISPYKSPNQCETAVTLPKDAVYGTTFSFDGFDNLHLEKDEGESFPRAYQGTTLFSRCDLAPRFIIYCQDKIVGPYAICYPNVDELSPVIDASGPRHMEAHHNIIHPAKNSVAVHPTHADTEVTVQIADPILPHNVAYYPAFHLASTSSGGPHFIIGLSGWDQCASKITLPKDAVYGTIFAFGGFYNLHLEKEDDEDYPRAYDGATLFSTCGRGEPTTIHCRDTYFPYFTCWPNVETVIAHHNTIHPAKNSVAVHPTHAETEVTLRINDHILPHDTDPRPAFYVAETLGSRSNVIILLSNNLDDMCGSKVILPAESPCGTTFSIGGVYNLHLENCDSYPIHVYQGEDLYSVCGGAPNTIIPCQDGIFKPFSTCYPFEASVIAHHNIIHPAKNSVAVHPTTAAEPVPGERHQIATGLLTDKPSFYIANWLGPEGVSLVILDADLSPSSCEAKVTLSRENMCGRTFSLSGFDNLRLDGCGGGRFRLLEGDDFYGYCGSNSDTLFCDEGEMSAVWLCEPGDGLPRLTDMKLVSGMT